MPYIAIKTFPKDEATKKAAVDKLLEIFPELWGCPTAAVSISIEEIEKEDWAALAGPEMEAKADNMLVLRGVKKY